MKPRTARSPSRAAPTDRFAIHPVGLAALLALAGTAHALPQGATVVGGQATVQNPSSTLQIVTQGTDKAIIDWRSFTIGAGEKVVFNQPGTASVLLNRVTGYDPSYILGQMQSNGRIFLLNPQGVVFGAGARIDVGGMVASTLSLSNADFMASRYSLASTPGVTLGEVRNEGTIRAPGGTVVLAGPRVANTGSIEADGGRVGLVAANSVLVDVEGDGLLFFQTSATEAGNRLQQLGRIRADGGSVELRAAARGSFADTVLNMSGVVQARSLGTRNGKVVIDGGASGTSVVAGTIDASGAAAGQTGGDVSVTGERVLIDATAAVDASGDAGGGRIRIGGGWQGGDAAIANAQRTSVVAGATLDASARGAGNGGEVVVWSDVGTRFGGAIRATGGAAGGDGGKVEISGKQGLVFDGRVDAGAAAGRPGSVLFDPNTIEVNSAGPAAATDVDQFSDSPGASLVVAPATLTAVNGSVTLQATSNITFTDAVTLTAAGASLTANAGNNIALNNSITTNGGAITLSANETSGTGSVTLNANLTGSAITISGPAQVTGTRTLTGSGAIVFSNNITGGGGTLALAGAGTKSLRTVTGLAAISVAVGSGTTTLNGDVTTSTSQTWQDTVLAGPVTLTSPSVNLAGAFDAGANNLGLQVAGLGIGGTLTGTGNLRLGPLSSANTISVASGVASDLTFSQGALSVLAGGGFGSLTVGRADGTGTISVGNGALTLPTDLTLLSNTGAINVTGGVNGGGHALTFSTGGTVTVGAAITNVSQLTNTGTTVISADVTTTGAQTYGTAQLGAAVTLTGTAINATSFDAANRNLALRTNDFTFTNAPTNLAGVTIGGLTAGTTIGVDTGAGTLSLTNAKLATFNGATSLTIGRADGTGTITVDSAGSFTLPRDLNFLASNAAINFNATVEGAHNLSVTNGGTTTFSGNVGAGPALTDLTSVTVSGGSTSLNGDVTTTAGQSYGNVSLGSGVVLTGTTVAIGGAVTGAGNALTLAGSTSASLGSASGLTSLDATGSPVTTLSGNVTSTGDQSYAAVTLAAPVTLTTGGAGAIDIAGNLVAGSNSLGLTTGALSITGGTSSGLGAVTVQPAAAGTTIGLAGGAGTFALSQATLNRLNGTSLTIGRTDGTGAITTGALTLPADTTLRSQSGTIALDTVTGAGHALTLTSSGTTTLDQGVSGVTSLVANGGGTTNVAGTIDTTGAQTYSDAVALTAATTLSGTTMSFIGGLSGAQDLTLTASAGVSLGGIAGLNSLTANGAGATTLTGGVTTLNAQSYGAVVLGADATLSGSQLTLGAVSGARNLTLTTTTAAGVALASATGLTSLASTGIGATTLNGNVSTTANQSYGDLTLGNPVALSTGTGATIALGGNLTGNGNTLSLTTDTLTIAAGTTTSLGAVTVQPTTAATTIGLAGGAGAFALSQATLDRLGGTSLTIGRADGSGAITANAITLPTDTVIRGNTALVTLGAVDGGAVANHDLTVTSVGNTTFGSTVTNVGNLTANGGGTTSLAASITTTGSQTYTDAVTLNAPTVLAGTTMSFAGGLNGNAQDLTLTASSGLTLGTLTGLNSLTANGAGTTTLNGNITTTAGQSFGTVVLGGNATLTGTTLSLGAVSGARDLTLTASTGATLGSATNLASLTANGAGATTLNGSVSTAGAQSYGAVVLGNDATLSGTSLALGVVNGAHDLTLTASTGTSLASVGLGTAPTSITANGAGATTLNGNVVTSGAQDWRALVLGNNVTLTGTTLDLRGPVSGASVLALAASTSATVSGAIDTAGFSTVASAGTTSLGANVTTTGTQTYGAVTLAAPVTLSGSAIDMTAAFAAGNRALNLYTSGLTITGPLTGTGALGLAGQNLADTIGVGAAAAATLNLSSTDLAGLAGGGFSSFTIGRAGGTGAIAFGGGTLVMPLNTTITGATAPVTIGTGIDAAGHTLAVTTGGTTTVTGAPTNLASFSTTGAATVSANLSTTGTQSYGGTVTLGGPVTLTGDAITLAGGLAAGASDIALRTHDLTLGGAVTGTGNATLAGFASSDTLGLGGGAGVSAFTAAEIQAFPATFASLTLGRADGTGAVTAGAFTLPTNTTIAGGSAPVSIGGTITGGNHALTIASTGPTTILAGQQANLGSLTVSGPVTFSVPGGGTIATNADQTYGGNVTLTTDTTLSAANIAFSNVNTALSTGTSDLVLQYDNTLTRPASASGNGAVLLAPRNTASTIGVAGGAGAFQVSQATLDALTVFPVLGVGQASGTGAITVGALTLSTDFQLRSGSGNVSLGSGVTGNGHALTVQTGGTTTLGGTLGTLSGLSVTGPAAVGGATTIVSTGNVSFGGTVDGPGGLAIQAAGATSIAGNVGATTALAAFSSDAAGTLSLGGNLRATGTVQVDDALRLAAASTTIDAGTLTLGGTVDGTAAGAQALVLAGAGTKTLAAPIGSTVPLAGLTSTAGTTRLGANVTTTGDQSYGAVLLTGAATLAGGNVTFGSTVDGTQALVVNSAGATTFTGAVGAAPGGALASLTTDAAGTTRLPGSVRTNGTQTYGDAVTLGSAATALTGGTIAFGSSVDGTTPGGQSLAINSLGATVFGGPVGATTALASLGTDIGGSTTLLGNVTTTGAQGYNDAVVLGANAVLSGSDVSFGSTLDGGRTLTVNATGTTQFSGAVGATTALTSLATDAGGTTLLGGSVRTTGAQTYGDAVQLQADTALTGSAVAFGAAVDGAHALSITGPASFAANVGTGAALSSLSVSGAATLPARVTTTGAQTWGGNAQLGAPTTLTADAIAFGGNVAAGANDVTTVVATSLTLAGTATGSGSWTVTPSAAGTTVGIAGGAGTLQVGAGLVSGLSGFSGLTIGRADGTGAIAVGNASLSAPTTIRSGTGAIGFGGNVTGNGRALTADTLGMTTVSGSIAGVSSFTVPHAATLAGGSVTTTGAQTYGAAVTVLGNVGLDAGTMQFTGAVDGPGTLTATAPGGMNFAAPVGATTPLGGLTVAGPVAVDGGSVRTSGAQNYLGALTLGAATTLTGSDIQFASTVTGAQSLTVADAGTTRLGGNVTTAGAQVYGGAVQLAAPVTLGAASVDFGGSVDGAQALVSNATGQTRFGGPVGATTPLTSLTVAGAARIDGGSVATTGAQAWNGPVVLGAATSLTGGSLQFTGTLDGPGALTATTAGGVGFGGNVGSAAALGSLAVTAGGPITLGGNVTTTGTQTFGGATLLSADATLSGSAVSFAGALDGAQALTVNAAGATSFGGAVGAGTALASLTTDAAGTTALATGVRTTGAQSYGDAVRLNGAATLTGTAVSFASTLDGAQALTVNAADTRFGGNVGSTTALTSLTTDAAGTTRLGGNVATTGAQVFGDALVLDADAALTASTLTLGRVDGARTLVANAPTTLGGAIGTDTPLAALTVNAATAMNGGAVRTSGAQAYAGVVTLGAPTTLAAGSVAFGAALDGAQSLAIQTAGTTSFGASVGAATPLASLAVAGGGTTTLAGSRIVTSGAQSYGGALQVSGDTVLSAASLTLGGNLTGARNLDLEADALAGSGGVSGTGTLTIAPRDAARSIGIAGGAGDLQVTQALLSSGSGFAQQVIGHAAGTGAVEAGTLALASATTIRSGSGEIHLGGAVDGAFDLTLATGGTTRISAPVGAGTALRSLTTDNAAAADWDGSAGEHTRLEAGATAVVTTGAQVYNDPLVTDGAVRFVASALTARSTANAFGGPITGTLGTADLQASSDLTIGDLTVSGGGTIESAGTIGLNGNLALTGGTLSLVSNAPLTLRTGFSSTDPTLPAAPSFNGAPLREADAVVFQVGGSVSSTAGSLLVVRASNGGSILFDGASNTLLGDVSAISGPLGDTSTTRFTPVSDPVAGLHVPVGVVRLSSSEIHAVNIEGDVVTLTADVLTTGTGGLVRARLPFDNLQGSQTSLPALTLNLGTQALAIGGGFGTPDPASWINVQVGSARGGYLTIRPKGAGGGPSIVLLAGPDPKPFYDGAGKLTEVRVFYNGATPPTPQETGALNAVIALVEEARHARFEEAVRTENVSSRLRSGVIAEVGSGRPATVGRESIRMPEVCNLKPGALKCE